LYSEKLYNSDWLFNDSFNLTGTVQASAGGARYLEFMFDVEPVKFFKVTGKENFPLPKKYVDTAMQTAPLCAYASEARANCWWLQDGLRIPFQSQQVQNDMLALRNQIATDGIWNISPPDNTNPDTPICCPPDQEAGPDGYGLITGEMLAELKMYLNTVCPGLKDAEWCIILDPVNFIWLLCNDEILKAQQGFMGSMNSVWGNIPQTYSYKGFNIRCDGRLARYNEDTLTKNPQGSTDGAIGALFYVKGAYVTAMGDARIFGPDEDACMQEDYTSMRAWSYVGLPGCDWSCMRNIGVILRKKVGEATGKFATIGMETPRVDDGGKAAPAPAKREAKLFDPTNPAAQISQIRADVDALTKIVTDFVNSQSTKAAPKKKATPAKKTTATAKKAAEDAAKKAADEAAKKAAADANGTTE